MFRCQQCGRSVPAGQSSHEVVLEVRQKSYAPFTPPPSKKRGKKKSRSGAMGHGWETARSAKVCSTCAPELEQKLAGRIASLGTPVEVIEDDERAVA